MTFSTTDERVHALRVTYAYVMTHQDGSHKQQAENIKKLLRDNAKLPHSHEQQEFANDLLESLTKILTKIQHDQSVSA